LRLTSAADSGIGIALVPESAALVRRKGIEFREFAASLPQIDIYAVWRTDDNSPLLNKVLQYLKRYAS